MVGGPEAARGPVLDGLGGLGLVLRGRIRGGERQQRLCERGGEEGGGSETKSESQIDLALAFALTLSIIQSNSGGHHPQYIHTSNNLLLPWTRSDAVKVEYIGIGNIPHRRGAHGVGEEERAAMGTSLHKRSPRWPCQSGQGCEVGVRSAPVDIAPSIYEDKFG